MSENNQYFEELCKFIEEAKITQNFSRVASAAKPISASEDAILCELTVAQEHVNGKRTMHGGQSASLIDIFTQWAVKITNLNATLSSVDISCSYMNPTPFGETIYINAKVLKKGRTMAFTECEIRRKSDNRLLVKGQQTLSILNN
uniref:Acyl-coenzyme A thioesterase 13 n=1 Tax=Panagrolaimus superbus TaxID=310955 RepID=A0A914ZDZ7_9BILA